DNLLREVYMNRYHLGREYYNVQDYNRTFDHMLEMMERKRINEDTASMGDMEYLDNQYSVLSSVINECSCDLRLQVTRDNSDSPGYTGTKAEKEKFITESNITLSF